MAAIRPPTFENSSVKNWLLSWHWLPMPSSPSASLPKNSLSNFGLLPAISSLVQGQLHASRNASCKLLRKHLFCWSFIHLENHVVNRVHFDTSHRNQVLGWLFQCVDLWDPRTTTKDPLGTMEHIPGHGIYGSTI